MSQETNSQSERTTPESFRARSMSVSLTVKDLETSLTWYRDVVGFTVDQRYEREGKLMSVALKAGSVRILINQDDGAKGFDRAKGEGFSLLFGTAQDVDRIADSIKERGGTLATEPADMPWGTRAFRLVDPDGFRLAISTERPES